MSPPIFGYKKNDVNGYHPDIYFNTSETTSIHHLNDHLLANLFNTTPLLFSSFLKSFGGIGPRNWATYFSSETVCQGMLYILEYLYDMIHNNNYTWLTLMRMITEGQIDIFEISNGIINSDGTVNDTSSINKNTNVEERKDFYLGNEKTYIIEESYQNTYKDINFTKKDSKELNQGNIMYNPFRPNQSKKPPHITII